MRVAYEAENLIDAHLVRGRLQCEGIDGFVRGEYLAGGIGELPVHGLLAVCVAEADLPRALQLIEQWNAERDQTDDESDANDLDDAADAAAVFVA